MKILGPNDFGVKGYLIEYDAGYVSADELHNKKYLKK